jgi:1,4-alpha-glucan branching enzyme
MTTVSDTPANAPRGAFTFVLHGHLPYVLTHGTWPHGSDMLFECAAESYLPLLQTFDRLVSQGVSPKVTLGITPVLAEQLCDPEFRSPFLDYLDLRSRTAAENRDEFKQQNQPHLAELAEGWRKHFLEIRRAFHEVYAGDLIAGFRRLQDDGHIEIITSAATHGYLPLIGSDESIQAQIKQAVRSYQRHFQRPPRGFWLPECAYRPRYQWASPLPDAGPQQPRLRKGVEEFLAESGIQYFIVDTATLLGGAATGVYLERFAGLQRLWERFRASYRPGPVDLDKSPYQAYLVASAVEDRPPVAVFTRDERTGIQVWSGEHGYPGDGWYLDFHKKHFPGGHRYWRVTSSASDLGSKEPYQPDRADQRVPENADHFCRLVHDLLAENHHPNGRFGILCAPYDAELFGHWWFEGPQWLHRVLQGIAADPTVDLLTCSEYLDAHTPQAAVSLPESSWGQGGFHWIWLNEWTTWIWKHIYSAEADMPALAQLSLGSQDSLLSDIVTQAARELLLLEASDWPFLISTWTARDYAEARAAFHHEAFSRLAQMARCRARGEDLSSEDNQFLHDCRTRDSLFPDLDLDWWARLERPPQP